MFCSILKMKKSFGWSTSLNGAITWRNKVQIEETWNERKIKGKRGKEVNIISEFSARYLIDSFSTWWSLSKERECFFNERKGRRTCLLTCSKEEGLFCYVREGSNIQRDIKCRELKIMENEPYWHWQRNGLTFRIIWRRQKQNLRSINLCTSIHAFFLFLAFKKWSPDPET